jgi:putative ABC transport system permease protein
MRNRLGHWLGRLMPADTRRELFEPAVHDLHAEAARAGAPSSTSLATLLLFFQCWRLAPAEVLSMILHDIRHALRLLVREPGFTAAAVLTLALGVGANVAVFAVVNAALLRPLPYPDADALVLLQHQDRRTGITKDFIAIGDFLDVRARQRSFESLAGYGNGRATIYGEGDPFDVATLQATPDLLPMLGTQPAHGRALTPDDAREGSPPVMMLGYELWQQRFASDPRVIGRSLKVGAASRQVVGIAAPGFRFPANAKTEAIVPMRVPAATPAQRKSGWVFGAARLKSGVTVSQACVELAALSAQMEQQFPADNQGSRYCARTLRDGMVGETRKALLLLLGAVAVVLLIACVNVANLLVARAVGRRQEMAVRVALGASRPRLIAQTLTESLVLAAIAGSAGVLFAHWATPVLVSLVPASVNLPELATVGVDRAVLGFAAAVTLITAIVFGVISAFGISMRHATSALVNPGRVSASGAARDAAAALVVVEMALAIVLLTGAGLVLRSFARLLAVDPGFAFDRVLTLDVALPSDRYRDAGARSAFYTRAFDAVRQIDGVEAAGAATVMPLTGNNWTVGFDRADRPVPAGQRPPDVGWQAASGGYFEALQIPLRAGRLFNATDRPGGPPVVIISEAIRDRFFPGEDPIGKKILGGDTPSEIVGVVGDIRRAALTDQPRADLYFPAEQAPSGQTSLFIRTAGDPRAVVAAVREKLRAAEPLIVMRAIQPMTEIVRESVQVTRLAVWLLGIFAASALLLASVGIYGVMSYAVTQRTRELGTRLALGATPSSILWLVMRDGLRVAGIGAAIGLVVGIGAARSMSAMLFGTSPVDPATLAAATSMLLGVALLACYVPARRATRLDPRQSLTGDR